jgi:hypothetical protein
MLTMLRYCGKRTRALVFHASRKGVQKFLRAKSKEQDTGAASKLRGHADEIGTLEIFLLTRDEKLRILAGILVWMTGLDVG